MQTLLTVVHLLLALSLIGLVLIQHGKGADAGAAFGSGASATVFGARGSGNFLSRTTAILATLFFVTSIALAYYAAQVTEPEGLMSAVPAAPSPLQVTTKQTPVPEKTTAPAAGDLPSIPMTGQTETGADLPVMPPAATVAAPTVTTPAASPVPADAPPPVVAPVVTPAASQQMTPPPAATNPAPAVVKTPDATVPPAATAPAIDEPPSDD